MLTELCINRGKWTFETFLFNSTPFEPSNTFRSQFLVSQFLPTGHPAEMIHVYDHKRLVPPSLVWQPIGEEAFVGGI